MFARHTVSIAFTLLLSVFTQIAGAAKAPLSEAELRQTAVHVVSGAVLSVAVSKEKSKIEKGLGIHRDKVYRITLRVDVVSKTGDEPVTVGQKIELIAWQPALRVPPVPGLQGHESIPKKGDRVTAYLKGTDGKAFKPILPNGLRIHEETVAN